MCDDYQMELQDMPPHNSQLLVNKHKRMQRFEYFGFLAHIKTML